MGQRRQYCTGGSMVWRVRHSPVCTLSTRDRPFCSVRYLDGCWCWSDRTGYERRWRWRMSGGTNEGSAGTTDKNRGKLKWLKKSVLLYSCMLQDPNITSPSTPHRTTPLHCWIGLTWHIWVCPWDSSRPYGECAARSSGVGIALIDRSPHNTHWHLDPLSRSQSSPEVNKIGRGQDSCRHD